MRADGFHGPREALGEASDFAWRSSPAHDDEDVRRAARAGATAVFVSPIFESPGKAARGVEAIRRARELAPALILVALGGIDEESAPACRAAGADGVAVVRALLDAPDPERVARSLWRGMHDT